MKAAAVARFRSPPEVMDLPTPAVGDQELLVKIEFAGVNPFDWKIMDGFFDGKRPHVFPLILGVDAAGTVDAVGGSVGNYRVGDRVFGQFLHDPVGTGTYAEFAPVPEGIGITRVPPSMALDEAAALPMAGMTALESLDALSLPPGSRLVIIGASGGVGSFATELAAVRGIKVTAIARPGSAARLRILGAEDVVDPSAGDAVDTVRKGNPLGVDGILDVMSDRPGLARWASVVRPGGTAATTTFTADIESLRRGGIRGVNVDVHPRSSLLDRLAREIVEHHLRIPLERRVRLSEAAAALGELKAGRASGKTVVNVRS